MRIYLQGTSFLHTQTSLVGEIHTQWRPEYPLFHALSTMAVDDSMSRGMFQYQDAILSA